MIMKTTDKKHFTNSNKAGHTIEFEPQDMKSTAKTATTYSRVTTLTGYKLTGKFPEKKIHCSQVSNGSQNRLDLISFFQSNFRRLFHLDPEDC